MSGSGTAATTSWRYLGYCHEGQRFEVDGVNLWDCPWDELPDVRANVKEPQYGQDLSLRVYDVWTPTGPLRVASGEYSMNVYLFFCAEP